ncbi:MAG: YARHG domain-containing protein [Flavipsychrobacter sp.]|nr:YARHG domain-containing protein [Flavipsychrobacter sp.]
MKAVVAFLMPIFLLFAACNNGIDIHLAKERAFEMQITRLQQRIKVLQDSLSVYTSSADTGTVVHGTTSKNRSIQDRGNGNGDPSEPNLYKNIVFHHAHVSQSTSNTPGLFPEGSDRLLFIKDVVYLSDWGHQLMLNEIYARHGMIFNNIKLSNHFNAQRWYHGTSYNVTNKLSTTELQNVEFLKTYKYSPDPQVQ